VTDDCCDVPAPVARSGARPQIALAGNPNVGKTTLFNALTGSSAKVSNYPGITVERRAGRLTLPDGRTADVHDLPGTYSLNARSAEEQIAFDSIVGVHGTPVPDVVVVCIDATQIARSAYLLLQCQELGARCVAALTMVDDFKQVGAAPDARALGALLGCEVVPVTARTRAGIPELVAAVDRALRSERRAIWRWTPGDALRAGLDAVRPELPAGWRASDRYGTPLPLGDDALALWALTCIEPRTGDADDDELDVPAALRAAAIAAHADVEAPILARWAFLDREVPKLVTKKADRSLTQRIDRLLLHRAAGFAVFIAVMSIVFIKQAFFSS